MRELREAAAETRRSLSGLSGSSELRAEQIRQAAWAPRLRLDEVLRHCWAWKGGRKNWDGTGGNTESA